MDHRPLPDHLSVSAIQLYRRCPAQWKRRYVDGIADEPTPQMAFGKAFALALEAHHLGADGDVMFARAHAASRNAVPGAEYGLRLLALYRERFDLDGRPERPFTLHLPDRHRLPVPIHGAMDLEREREVVEFKTARNPWSLARADAEYQSAVYGWAFEQRHGRPPSQVRYLVFSTRAIGVQEILKHPTASDFAQFELAAIQTWSGIVDGDFEGCGRCPLCRPAEADETYDWWPAAPAMPEPAPPAAAPPVPAGQIATVAPAEQFAYWSRPSWRARRDRLINETG